MIKPPPTVVFVALAALIALGFALAAALVIVALRVGRQGPQEASAGPPRPGVVVFPTAAHSGPPGGKQSPSRAGLAGPPFPQEPERNRKGPAAAGPAAPFAPCLCPGNLGGLCRCRLTLSPASGERVPTAAPGPRPGLRSSPPGRPQAASRPAQGGITQPRPATPPRPAYTLRPATPPVRWIVQQKRYLPAWSCGCGQGFR